MQSLKSLKFILILFCITIFLVPLVPGQTTYTWNVNGSGAWTNATNWTPSRTAPAANDILVFDGNIAFVPITISNIQTETIQQLHLLSSVSVSLDGTVSATLTIGGDGSFLDDLTVPAGCTLRITGTNTVSVELSLTATGLIGGDIIFNATGANKQHRIISKAGGALVFQSGSSAAMAPKNGGAGGGFGGNSAPVPANGGVIFLSGSTYYQGGLKDGTRNGAPGTTPFGLNQPQSAVVFNPGSTYLCWDGTLNIAGRTYGHFIWRGSISQTAPAGAAPLIVNGNFIVRNSGIVDQGNIGLSGHTGAITVTGNFIVETGAGQFIEGSAPTTTQNFSIGGNVDIQDPSLFNPTTNINRVYRLNGIVNQNVNFAGATLPNLTVNNTSNITLTGNVTVAGQLNLIAGELVTGSNTITAADGLTGVIRTSGFVNGTLTRNINAANTGIRSFPIGTTGKYAPVDFEITIAGTGSGTLAVNSTDGDHPNLPGNGADAINRYWNLTASVISGFTADITFTYLDGDLDSVDEITLIIARYLGTGTNWEEFEGASIVIDQLDNTAKVIGVLTLSDWTLYEAGSLIKDWMLN